MFSRQAFGAAFVVLLRSGLSLGSQATSPPPGNGLVHPEDAAAGVEVTIVATSEGPYNVSDTPGDVYQDFSDRGGVEVWPEPQTYEYYSEEEEDQVSFRAPRIKTAIWPRVPRRAAVLGVNRKGVDPAEALTRYPSTETPGGVIRSLDYLGTVAFAMGGAVTAGRHGMNLMGAIVVGTITAVGGGTTRDVLMGQTPVFWMQEAEYLGICVLTAAATQFLWPTARKWSILSASGGGDDGVLPVLLDTIGLGAFSVVGTQHGIRKGLHPFLSMAVALITCSFGGIIRDVLTGMPARILHSHAEMYAATALFGSGVYLFARTCTANASIRVGCGFGATVLMRALACAFGLRLPVMKGLPVRA